MHMIHTHTTLTAHLAGRRLLHPLVGEILALLVELGLGGARVHLQRECEGNCGRAGRGAECGAERGTSRGSKGD